MKIFERDGKINFVDDKNVFVGFDNYQNCCESFGYYFTHDGVVANSSYEDTIPDQKDFTGDNLAGFSFDKEFFKTESDEAIFQLVNRMGKAIYLHLYNHHNGYYGHGFTFSDDGFTIQEGTL